VGHKVHPTGFRLGIIYDWQSRWFADRGYTTLLHEDLEIRRFIARYLSDAGVSRVEIDRNANQVVVTIYTAKPGIVIGRGGQKVDELRNQLEALGGRRVRVNIQEIRQPEMDAYLVARTIADQLKGRVSFRRATKQAVSRTMQRGAKGIKVIVAGRLGGTEMSRRETEKDGRVPLHTLRADIDYGHAESHTTFGCIGVKVWIYKGDILPEPKEEVAEVEEEAAAAAPTPDAQAQTAEAVPVPPAEEPAAQAKEPAPQAEEPAPQAEEPAQEPEASAPEAEQPAQEPEA